MLTGHKTLPIEEIRHRLKSGEPDTVSPAAMPKTLEQVNGYASDSGIFSLLLPPLIEAVSNDLAKDSFYQSAAETLKQYPEKSALALMEVAKGGDPEKSRCALMQLDLLVGDTVCNKEGKAMEPHVQKDLIPQLEKLLTRHEHNISLLAGNILNNLHHNHNRPA